MNDAVLPLNEESTDDRRFMAAAIRYSRIHHGLTSTNPSVGCLIVRDDGFGKIIVGRGVTALEGRPHAETLALAQAGEKARGATAYVTLEPCAHHGKTPPCAEALVAAGIARVVVAAPDPDIRVSGRGVAILRNHGVAVTQNVLAAKAKDELSSYLIRSVKKRPEVILKLALSQDGYIGRHGAGQVAITGTSARAQVHIMRAQSDAILVGVGTVLADDPMLDCRLPGLAQRSPIRVVLDGSLRIAEQSRLVCSAQNIPTWIVTGSSTNEAKSIALTNAGCHLLPMERAEGQVNLPKLLAHLASQGISSLMVEGGARTASAFLEAGLVDRLAIFTGPDKIGPNNGIEVAHLAAHIERSFTAQYSASYGADSFSEYVRNDECLQA